MNEPVNARKLPVVIQAIQWTGTNQRAVLQFTGASKFLLPPPGMQWGDGQFSAKVFDRLHAEWIPLRTGDWVMCGVKGEFYPCEQDTFDKTYEIVSADDLEVDR